MMGVSEMKKAISLIVSLIVLLNCFVICQSSYAVNFDNDSVFYSNFDISQDELSDIIKNFEIDPSNKQAGLGYELVLTEEEYISYFYTENRDEFFQRCGFADEMTGMQYVSGPYKYGEEMSDGKITTYYQFSIMPEQSSLSGVDYMFFAAKMIYAAGYKGTHNDNPFPGFYKNRYMIDGKNYYNFTYENDVNFDGSFNIKDLAFLKKYIAGSEDRINKFAADQNQDGYVSIKDLIDLKKVIANG